MTGKTFLNTIEYLDEKTDEWTTFVPKDDTDLLFLKSRSRTNSKRSLAEEITVINNDQPTYPPVKEKKSVVINPEVVEITENEDAMNKKVIQNNEERENIGILKNEKEIELGTMD